MTHIILIRFSLPILAILKIAPPPFEREKDEGPVRMQHLGPISQTTKIGIYELHTREIYCLAVLSQPPVGKA